MATHYQVVLAFEDICNFGQEDAEEVIQRLNVEIKELKIRVWEPFKLVLDDLAVGEFRNHPSLMGELFKKYECTAYFNDDSITERLKELV